MSKEVRTPFEFVALSATPPNPPAGSVLIYAKNDGSFYQLESNGAETKLANVLGGGNFALTQIDVNLGTNPATNGQFIINGSGLTAGKHVAVTQAVGDGENADAMEFDQILVSAKVISTTEIQCYWSSRDYVMGTYKFNYIISG